MHCRQARTGSKPHCKAGRPLLQLGVAKADPVSIPLDPQPPMLIPDPLTRLHPFSLIRPKKARLSLPGAAKEILVFKHIGRKSQLLSPPSQEG